MAISWDRIRSGARPGKPKLTGFSLIELLVVVTILAVLAAISVPLLLNAVHTVRLRGAGTDFSGILQQARMRAVQDDRFYSVYGISNNGLQQEFVDIYPQQVNGASGSGGQNLDPKDPVVSVNSEIVEQPASAAPNRGNLRQQLFGGGLDGMAPPQAGGPLRGHVVRDVDCTSHGSRWSFQNTNFCGDAIPKRHFQLTAFDKLLRTGASVIPYRVHYRSGMPQQD